MYEYYSDENTAGYTQEELDLLNAELAQRLQGTEPHTPKWWEIIKQHNDEVARR